MVDDLHALRPEEAAVLAMLQQRLSSAAPRERAAQKKTGAGK